LELPECLCRYLKAAVGDIQYLAKKWQTLNNLQVAIMLHYIITFALRRITSIKYTVLVLNDAMPKNTGVKLYTTLALAP